MDELNQVLERMRKAFEEKREKNASQPTQPLGSISEGGSLTIAQNQKIIPPQENQNGHPRETDSPKNTLLKAIEKAELAKTLSRICALQQKFGLTPSEVEVLVDGFIWAIENTNYPFQVWIAAMAKHVLTSTEIPRPADILNIINPPKQQLSTAMYIQIMKDCTIGGKLLYGEKKEFVDAYVAQEMAKVRGGSQELRDAQLEIQNHQRLALSYEEVE